MFVSANKINFVLLGVAADDVVTAFDLGFIGFTKPVQAAKIVGLDNFSGSPGFDVMNIQVLPGSIGTAVREPGFLSLVAIGLGGLVATMRRRRG
ncbi:MAG TPA: hypothetical protein VIT91_20655 [Chthoniobacterales bacterium]